MKTIRLITSTPRTDDPERAVLPTLIYVKQVIDWASQDSIGFGLAIGWWAWGVGIVVTNTKPKTNKSKGAK